LTTSEFLLQTGLKRYLEIGKDNTAFGLISNGESVSNGKMATHAVLRLLTTIEVKK